MTKQEQFLFIVQTVVLTNGVNLSSQPDVATGDRHVFSATGVIGLMDDALFASERIPSDKSAFESAHEWCYFMLSNLRKEEEKATGKEKQVPYWFARS